jgi:AsmA family protein
MKKWHTMALGTVGAIVIAVLAAAFAVHALVAPERLAQKAREKAQEAWSRDLAIETASLSFWPAPVFHANNVVLAAPAGAKSPSDLRAKSLSARLEWLPLLLGKARFKGVELEGVNARLQGSRWHFDAVRAAWRESGEAIEVTDLAAAIGKTTFTGSGTWSKSGTRNVVHASLETDRLDWVRTLLDAGQPPLPPLPPEELFHDNPVAWPLLSLLAEADGAIDLNFRSVLLRNGVELSNAKARIALEGARLNMTAFTTELLGGSAKGSMQFDPRKKSVRVNFDGTNLLLERWFHERGSDIPFKGGPMRVTASLAMSGDSMKALGASITGPVTIRMGPGVWASAKAGRAEEVMVHFSAKESSEIAFECIAANLPFATGRAAASSLIGARSTVASLLTSGYVDLREETLDLRGPVRGKGGTVGLATIAPDMKITGPIRRPKASIDHGGTAKTIARVGAAILTAGASLRGSAKAAADKANESDACQVAFAGSTPAQLTALK